MSKVVVSVWRVAGRYAGLVFVAALAGIALLGFAFPTGPVPRLAVVNPIAYFVVVLADAATALVLIATSRYASVPRSKIVLGMAFAGCGVLTLLTMMTLPLLPKEPAVLHAAPQTGLWLLTCWRTLAAGGALIYIVMRHSRDAGLPSRRFIGIAAALTIVALTACVASVFLAGRHLPSLQAPESLAPLLSSWIGLTMAATLAITAVLAYGIPKSNIVDRALGLSLLALSLDTAIFAAGAPRFTEPYYTARILLVVGALAVLVSAIRSLVGSRVRLRTVETSLTRVTGESADRAGRIRALWQMSSDLMQPEKARYATSLRLAAAALRPRKAMLGRLSHIVGGAVVVDAISWTEHEAPQLAGRVFPGAVLPLENTLESLLTAGTHALAWDDLLSTYGHGSLCERLGWRSFIGAPITIAGRMHFITFVSQETMTDEPFAEEDIAFIDAVANFFSSRFTQQLQFEQIQFQVEHDALTGLQNRVQFRQAIGNEMRLNGGFTVALVNLDGFRHVNEQKGYLIGDEVLVQVAADLASIDANNVIARMDGDEFALLLRGRTTTESATAALSKYAEVFRAPLRGDAMTGIETIGASIGAARFPADGSTAEEIVRRAHVALDVAKTRGGSTSVMFEWPMERVLEEKRLRAVEVVEALAHDHFTLLYQPTFDLATRQVTGAEALIRWDHPVRGQLPPSEFIGFAERHGMIGALSRWVLARIVRDLSDSRELPPGFRVYFNLSAQLLDDVPFIAELSEALRAAPSLTEHLGIEVTESAAMQNVERSMHTIDLLRRWGLSVAIDDFGTGYSSLSYLKQLTVDVVKIDKSFIAGLPHDERDAALTETLLDITTRLGFATLAEGIETEAQLNWLIAHGCRFGQGYLVAKPAPFAELLLRLGAPVAA